MQVIVTGCGRIRREAAGFIGHAVFAETFRGFSMAAGCKRTLQLEVLSEDGESIVLEGNLQDPFHDITVNLTIEKQEMRIKSAFGRMDRVPYPVGCSTSLYRLEEAVGIEIRQGLSRNLRGALGGRLGCPYLVEIAEQICRFALVVIKSDEARQLIDAGENARFIRLKEEMGLCAGHTLARVEELPDWLKQEMRGKKHDQ